MGLSHLGREKAGGKTVDFVTKEKVGAAHPPSPCLSAVTLACSSTSYPPLPAAHPPTLLSTLSKVLNDIQFRGAISDFYVIKAKVSGNREAW